ncbi:MAG: diguanylate cyclase, partial [Gammaproteobacteria bacterium]
SILLIVVLALTSINYLRSLHNKIDNINQQDMAKVVLLHKMSHIVRERSLRMYAMYFSRDYWTRDAEYQRFHALAGEFIGLRKKLLALGLQPQEQTLWKKAMAIIRVTEPLQDKIVDKLHDGKEVDVSRNIGRDDLPRENQLLVDLDKLLDMVQQKSNLAVAQAEHQFSNGIRLLSVITLGVIALGLTNMLVVRKRIMSIESEMHEEKELAQLTLENIIDGVIKTDEHGLLVSVNPAAEHICGWRKNIVISQSLGAVFNITSIDTGASFDWQDFLGQLSGTVMPLERYFELQRADGSSCLIEISVSPIFTSNGKAVEYAYIFRDVTSEKRQADEVSWQANHDPLTQVLNRNAIVLAIKSAIASAQQNGEQHVLLYIDLDDFKLVNDQYGHVAGDDLLIGICREMEQCVRKGDRIARMGGDEFTILLLECDLAHAVNIAEKIRHNVSRYCFEFDNNRICCSGLSIGINIINGQSRDWKTVMEKADQSCYKAKRQGKNQVSVA